MTAKVSAGGGADNITLYPTLTAFLDATKQMTQGKRPASQMSVEAFILALLVRWQLEDEGSAPDNAVLVDTNKDLTELNEEMNDDERGAVMRQLVLWVTHGDGWLSDYIVRLSKSTSPESI